jgi:methionyl aminopeptidase
MPFEQGSAQLFFEAPDLAAQWRLRDVKPPGGSSDVSLFRNGHEVANLVQTHVESLSTNAGLRSCVLTATIPKRYWTSRRWFPHCARVTITLLSPDEVVKMEAAGRVAAATLDLVAQRIRAGISTADIDTWVRRDTATRGGHPAQLGYRVAGIDRPFPAAVCTSVNEVVCHGIPSRRRLVEGDIINVDVTTQFDGYHGDTSRTFIIGNGSDEARHVTAVARECLFAGLEVVRPGARLGDVGAAIESLARSRGCSVVREFGGHGIGRFMHCAPHVSHHGKRGTGVRLRPGMAFTIEPMVNLGGPEVAVLEDGWTVVTLDGSLSAQFEHTVIVTESGARVTTLVPGDGSRSKPR